MKTKVTAEDAIDRAAQSIITIKREAEGAHEHREKCLASVHKMQSALFELCRTDDTEEVVRLKDRIEEKIRLLNSLESGAFSIEINRKMDEAWRRLP